MRQDAVGLDPLGGVFMYKSEQRSDNELDAAATWTGECFGDNVGDHADRAANVGDAGDIVGDAKPEQRMPTEGTEGLRVPRPVLGRLPVYLDAEPNQSGPAAP